MTDTTFNQHYSPADRAAVQRIVEWMKERQYSQAALARLARTSSSTLNQIIKGVYISPPTKILTALESAMRQADASAEDAAMPPVETTVFKLVQACCATARRNRNFSLACGYVGTGKTFALKTYVRKNRNTWMIEATPSMTPQGLVRLLARMVLGVDGKGSMNDKFTAVVDTLRDTDSLIIVDEAETMTHKQLHLIRRLRDLANIGVVLAGTEYLMPLIRAEHGHFDQIRSRTGFWPEVVKQITAEDAGALVQSHFGAEDVPDEVVQRLYSYCKGSARMLCEGFLPAMKTLRKGRELTTKLVDAVATEALSLKSLA